MSAERLLGLLADGAPHSMEGLTASMNISRAAVRKDIARLRSLGIEVGIVPRAGYHLREAVELLDEAAIRASIGPDRLRRMSDLQLHLDVGSTNTRLLQTPMPEPGSVRACLTELQARGRGRRGRTWHSPFGAGIALSLSWTFDEIPQDLSALSLAAGVAIVQAARRCGARGVQLKWPNDIWFQDRKLGGILIETLPTAGGGAFVVTGVGLNVALSAPSLRQIEFGGSRAAGLAEACAIRPSRNAVAGAMIDELVQMLVRFAAEGFGPYRQRWEALDALRDRAAIAKLGAEGFSGIARGIDADGRLLLEDGGELRKFFSGEASLSPRAVNS